MQHDFEVYGTKGALFLTQERLNELRYYNSADPVGRDGFRTILAGPKHPPYGNFCIAPGHQLGFNDLKAIEIQGFLEAVAGRQEEPHRIGVPGDDVDLLSAKLLHHSLHPASPHADASPHGIDVAVA